MHLKISVICPLSCSCTAIFLISDFFLSLIKFVHSFSRVLHSHLVHFHPEEEACLHFIYIALFLAFLPCYLVPSQPVLPLQHKVDPLLITFIGQPIDVAFHFLVSIFSQAMARRTAMHIFYLEDDLYNTNSYLGWICIYHIWEPLEKHLCKTPCNYSDVLHS